METIGMDRQLRSRYRGCLLAGAVGDALGAPVEMMSWPEIQKAFGESGITDLTPAYGKIGSITDDTQMTLFTGEGILRSLSRSRNREIGDPYRILRRSYLRWLVTQGEPPPEEVLPLDPGSSWLFRLPEMHAVRLPGNTCLSALRLPADPKSPRLRANNSSKGCGGVMRVAPVALANAFGGDSSGAIHHTFWLAGRVAELTHGHPASTASSGAQAVLLHLLLHGRTFPEALAMAEGILRECPGGEFVADLLVKTQSLAASSLAPVEAIREIGEGWVAEEALAIALFSCLRGKTLEESLLLAVNHGGDSDSTGAIAGNLMGARMGEEAIPGRWLSHLELREAIQKMADDLFDFPHWPREDVAESGWSRYPPF